MRTVAVRAVDWRPGTERVAALVAVDAEPVGFLAGRESRGRCRGRSRRR